MESADFSCLRDASLSHQKLELSKEMKDLDMQIEDSHAPRPPRSTHRYETHTPPPPKASQEKRDTVREYVACVCIEKQQVIYRFYLILKLHSGKEVPKIKLGIGPAHSPRNHSMIHQVPRHSSTTGPSESCPVWILAWSTCYNFCSPSSSIA